MKTLRRLPTLCCLSPTALAQIIEVFCLTCAVRLGFRIVGVASTQRALRSWAVPRIQDPAQQLPQSAIDVVAGAHLAQQRVRNATGLTGTCLVRSLVLWAMLRRRGIEASVRIGMRKTDGIVEGHAWVELDGRPLNESPDVIGTYSILPEDAAFDLWQRPAGKPNRP